MKASNRFLLGFGIAIALLVVVTLVLVLTAKNDISMRPENTPEGTVQRFLLAVQDKDYPKAFSYLRIVENNRTLSYDDWVISVRPPSQSLQRAWKATLGEIRVTGNKATVEVMMDIFRPGGPFENPVDVQTILFQLEKTDEAWFITQRPSLFWLY
ncbi:MAG: hypothetical protein Q8O43_07025 [Dehalococcoidia bacterium]|nr:hypothetical protein [Dehalococcoidia bacterium]